MAQSNPQNNNALVFGAAVAVAFVLILVAFVASHPNRPAVESVSTTILCPAPLHEVGVDICDDDVDTAYLMIRNEHYVPDEHILQQIVTSKKTWEKRFPARRIVAMIRTEATSGGNSILTGILIHYNNESK
ncbi:MAG: hypothetical protein NTX72_01535 [Candidatus Uhrbacteria bacterium]|nr:hypothetical protein [Candidatus Uhrbacteria bacterium]